MWICVNIFEKDPLNLVTYDVCFGTHTVYAYNFKSYIMSAKQMFHLGMHISNAHTYTILTPFHLRWKA